MIDQRRKQGIVARATVALDVIHAKIPNAYLEQLTLGGFSIRVDTRQEQLGEIVETLFLRWPDVAAVQVVRPWTGVTLILVNLHDCGTDFKPCREE